MGAVIEVSDLRKTYGEVRAVDGISFTVDEGEFFGILGPNGAGKTTTLEIVEGLRQPDGGEARLFGVSSWPRQAKLLPRIGVQLQASSFFERLTAREQLDTFASLYGASQSRVGEMLELVGLTEQVDTQTEKLSGGQMQRLSIACSLVHAPELVFLDEPSSGLDPQARRNLWDLLRSINADGRTVVLTTHYLDEAEILCDRVAIMDHGRILAAETPTAFIRGLDAPTHISVEPGVITSTNAAEIPGVDDVTDDGDKLTLATRQPAQVLTALAERNALDGLAVRGATLEDVFLDLTGREYRA